MTGFAGLPTPEEENPGAKLAAGTFAAAMAAVGVAMAMMGKRRLLNAATGDIASTVAKALKAASASVPPDDPLRIDASAKVILDEQVEASVIELASLWNRSEVSKGRRIEVIGGSSAAEVARLLVDTPSLDARSVWTRDASVQGAAWTWPLDIAFRSRQAAGIGAEVQELLDRADWVRKLIRVRHGGRGAGAEVLLVRGSPAEAAAIATGGRPPEARLILLQSETPADPAEIDQALTAASERHPGAAVAWAHVPKDRFESWLVYFVAELSHNRPLDLALFEAARTVPGGAAPVVRANAEMIERAKLSTSMTALGRRLRHLGNVGFKMAIPPGGRAEAILGMTGSAPAEVIADRLEAVPTDVGFAHETGLATAVTELAEALPPESEHRFLQAQLASGPGGETALPTWTSGIDNVLRVRIGQPDPSWLTPPEAKPFPVEAAVGDEEETQAEVVCLVPGVLRRPRRQAITIRRVGPSSICDFRIPVTANRTALRARVVVVHAGRVLQSGVLDGPVVAPGAAGAEATWRLDVMPRADLAGLRARQRFHASVLLEPGSTVVTDPSSDRPASFKAPPILGRLQQVIDGKFTDVGKQPDKYGPDLTSPASVDLIRSLAVNGAQVRRELEAAGLPAAVLSARRLQVVATTTSVRLPFELFYDGPAPLPAAPLCPHAVDALTAGKCPAACGPDQGGDQMVCPLRFWGLSRVIERHIESTTLLPNGGDFSFRPEPSGGRQQLRLFEASAVAGSRRVDKLLPTGLAALRTKLEALGQVAARHRLAVNWSDWTDIVGSAQPSFLMLLPHTQLLGVQPELEVGDDWLVLGNLTAKHICQGGATPLVALLGCETDVDPTEAFSIVTTCRFEGAAAVIAFGATIAVVHAVPAAEELIDQLAKATPGTLGDAILATRQRLVAKGWLAALDLTAYGDADWQLVH